MSGDGSGSHVLAIERQGRLAIITLNRPERLNAINRALHEDLLTAFAEIRDDDSIWAAVIVGAGRGFCSGADVARWDVGPETPSQTRRLDEMGWVGRQALALWELDKPTVAAVNGIAAGAGMALALGCDLRVGSASTVFRSMFIERSLSPDAGMTYFLTRLIGYSRAADLVLTSRTVTADEAFNLGLLNRLVDEDDLLSAAVELADQIAKWPPLALRASKRVLQHNIDCDLRESLLYERAGLRLAALAPNDRREALESFTQRREPVFTGT
jgi:2-(1,2-epoxy-1,2-dihydrophenyl)acetyl-CoA isomerase